MACAKYKDEPMDKKEQYLQAIRVAYPDFHIETVRSHDGEGQFNYILIINENTVFRFPRYQLGLDTLTAELAVLDSIQGHTSLPVPNPIYRSDRQDTLVETFMGYAMLPGQALWRPVFNTIKDEEKLQYIADQIADFLRGLHNIPTNMLSDTVPRYDAQEEWETMFAEFRSYLFPHMRPDARTAVTNHFENYFSDPILHEYAVTLRHGDFGTGNILYDPETASITGIIDFSYAGLGDPAVDIASITCFGPQFFQRLYNRYPEIETMLDRARFYKGTYALQEALHGAKNEDQEAFEAGMANYI